MERRVYSGIAPAIVTTVTYSKGDHVVHQASAATDMALIEITAKQYVEKYGEKIAFAMAGGQQIGADIELIGYPFELDEGGPSGEPLTRSCGFKYVPDYDFDAGQ